MVHFTFSNIYLAFACISSMSCMAILLSEKLHHIYGFQAFLREFLGLLSGFWLFGQQQLVHNLLNNKMDIYTIISLSLSFSTYVWRPASRPQWCHYIPQLPSPVWQQCQLHLDHYCFRPLQGMSSMKHHLLSHMIALVDASVSFDLWELFPSWAIDIDVDRISIAWLKLRKEKG